jgi:hypothetical protein
MDDEPLRRAEAHFGSIATIRSSPHLQGVVRATDSRDNARSRASADRAANSRMGKAYDK